jgi:CheY-like chemotaxis protein
MTNYHYKTCLLLEDDREDQEFFLRTLRLVCSHARCYAVSNGVEALSILKEERIKPDLIFTDIDMPRMNGLDFIQQLKESKEFQNIPVIVYSGSPSGQNVSKLQTLGVTAFYSKLNFRELPKILAKYLGM